MKPFFDKFLVTRSTIMCLAVAATTIGNLAAAADAPNLQSPADKSSSTYPFPHFTWTEHSNAFKDVARPVSYEIQIATDPTVSTIVDKDTVSLNRYVHDEPFTPGTYYWRVRAVPYEKKPAVWSAPQSFLIKDYDEEVRVGSPTGQLDHTAKIKAAARRAAEFASQGKSVKVVFVPGDYYLGDSLRGPLINLKDTDNILLDGAGARLHFSSRKQGLIRAQNCKNIAVLGFSSSFRQGALRIQGYVKAVDDSRKQVTVSIEPGYPGFDASSNKSHDIFYLLEPGAEGRLKSDTRNFFRAQGEISKNADNTWSFSPSKSCGDFLVRGSSFKNIRRYGTVFRSKRGVVESNTYEGISARGIVFVNGTAWPNGLYASEIIVRNNRIVDSCFDHPSGPAAISFLFNGYKRGATTIGPRNVLIEGNTIEDCPAPEIELSWVKNAVVRNNRNKLASGRLSPTTLASPNSMEVVYTKQIRE